MGGGPAGSLFAYFLLRFAHGRHLRVRVDIYEPRDFARPGPGGCNMCGGVVSESFLRALADEGIILSPTVVQRAIDAYVLRTPAETVRIEMPLREKRIAAVYRGGGPRDLKELRWGSLDSQLLSHAETMGARVIRDRVSDATWDDGRPQVRVGGEAVTYDLLVGATGVNAPTLQIFHNLGLPARPAATTRAYITELNLGYEAVTRFFGGAMHIFLIDLPRLEFAAIIPKGEFLTICLLGQNVDQALVDAFFRHPAVRQCLPNAVDPSEGVCRCYPKINIREAETPFADHVVLVGDCGVTRLYKDGLGAAYRTAKAAARTAALYGVSAADFRRYYWPVYRSIASDNRYGMLLFSIVRQVKVFRPFLKGVLSMVMREQAGPGTRRPMSTVLWDLFTGGAPYARIFYRTLDPRFVGRFLWQSALAAAEGAALPRGGTKAAWAGKADGPPDRERVKAIEK